MNGSTAEFEDLSAYSMSLGRLLEAFTRSNEKLSSMKSSNKSGSNGEREDTTTTTIQRKEMLSFACMHLISGRRC